VLDQSIDSIRLELNGYGYNLAKYYIDQPIVEISLNDLDKVKSKYQWTKQRNFSDLQEKFNESVSLISTSVNQIDFIIEQYESKNVPVELQLELNYKSGFDSFQEYKLSKDSITVTGPNSLIDTINVIETQKLVLNQIDSDINSAIWLKPSENQNVIYSEESIGFQLKVEKFTEESIKVPITIVNIDDNMKINYYPKVVSVLYRVSIKDYKAVNPMDFRVECDLNTINKDNSVLISSITKKPSNVKKSRIENNQIQYVIIE
ncbi:MAG TPA: CdaR family protein, partial [Flavobacteriaceae bacterium]|nr:CdaR family protein [Flavobacteriaceae bacterium]